MLQKVESPYQCYSPRFREQSSVVMRLLQAKFCWLIEVLEDNTVCLLGNDPDWVTKYFKYKLYLQDPHIVKHNNLNAGVWLWSGYEPPEVVNSCHGVTEGVSMVVHKNNKTRILCVPSQVDKLEFCNRVINNLTVLELWLQNIVIAIDSDCTNDDNSYRMDLASLRGRAFYQQVGVIDSCLLDVT